MPDQRSVLTAHVHEPLGDRECARLGRRAQLFAGVSVADNGVEAVVALVAGVAASSAALVGFGLDSVVDGEQRRIHHLLAQNGEDQRLP